jgi:multiple sugar transport system substrate-binding protein
MKKYVVMILSFLLLSLFAVGCSSTEPTAKEKGNDSSKQGTVEKKEEQKEEQKEQILTFWASADLYKGDDSPGAQMIQQFNEKHSGKIKVELRYMPWSEYNTAVQAGIASNDLPDIFNLPQKSDLSKFIEQDWIRPLEGLVSEDWKKQFYPSAFVEGINVIDGKTYTWPDKGPELQHMLYYNKDVMKNAGLDPEKPPKTWDELRSMSKQITENGKGDVYGLILGGAKGGAVNTIVEGFAVGTDPYAAKFNYKTGTFSYDHPIWTESVQLLIDLKEDGSIFPSSYTINPPEAAVFFGENTAAFMMDARWRMWLIKRDTPEANFGMAFIPTKDGKQPVFGDTIANSASGYMVSSGTEHPEAVGTFIEEGLASRQFYEQVLQSGVNLTPLPDLNNDKSAYPYPDYEIFAKLHKDLLRTEPVPAVKNPDTNIVMTKIGGMEQPAVKPNNAELFQMFLFGKETDIAGKLKEYNDKLNEGLQNGIADAKKDGANVDASDFIFPDWNPYEDYKQ